MPVMKMLGQKLAFRIRDEGVDFVMTEDPERQRDGLREAHRQLSEFADGLRRVVHEGLPLAVAHKMWCYTSAGAITHLMATAVHAEEDLDKFAKLQLEHLKWVTGRDCEGQAYELATLPLSLGGLGLPDYKKTAASIFLRAQARLLGATAVKLGYSTVDDFLATNRRHCGVAWNSEGCGHRRRGALAHDPETEHGEKGEY